MGAVGAITQILTAQRIAINRRPNRTRILDTAGADNRIRVTTGRYRKDREHTHPKLEKEIENLSVAGIDDTVTVQIGLI